MATDRGHELDAAKRRYARGRSNELDSTELGRIALIVAEVAHRAGDFETARQHAELAVLHYGDAPDEKGSVRAKRRLACELLAMRDWVKLLPLLDEMLLAEDGPEAELAKLDGLDDPKDRAIELARAHISWASGRLDSWTVVWGALMDAFADAPIAEELKRRFVSRLGKKNADVARSLRAYGFHKAAAVAAGLGTTSASAGGTEWQELAQAQRARGELVAAYESFCEAAARFEKAYDRASNTYTDEDTDPDVAIKLRKESRFDYKASRAWNEAAACAFVLGDRTKMDTANDREIENRLDPAEIEELASVRSLLAEGRTENALDLVRSKLRYLKGATPEMRGLFGGLIAEHVAAGRPRAAVDLYREILKANASTWGPTSPGYLVVQLDLANLLVAAGYVGEARAELDAIATSFRSPGEDHAFARACAGTRARVERSKDVELLECVHSARFASAKERLARMRELLAGGASIVAADAAGDTVLHHVARLRAADSAWLARALVDAGASRGTANTAGERPIDVAAANPAQVADVVEALLENDASPALAIAVAKGHLVTVARLVALGAGPAPPVLARPLPQGAGLVEFALRISRATKDTAIVDAAFSENPGVDDVRHHLTAFAVHEGRHAMNARFNIPHREKLVAELVFTIASAQILETLVRDDWSRFVREELGLLRASIPSEVDDELGEEDELLEELEMAFRGAAFDASPSDIREGAERAAFGR